MQELVDVCDAATFGLNHEDVLDVSYRSAWKLDPVYFASKLNIVHAGLMDSIRYNLLQGDQGRTTFYAELYKLNVYGEFTFALPSRIKKSISCRKRIFLQAAQRYPSRREDVWITCSRPIHRTRRRHSNPSPRRRGMEIRIRQSAAHVD